MDHRDGFPGALVPEELRARLGQRPADERRSATAGSDASVDARPAAVADAGLRALAGVDVGKSAGPVWGAQARDARQSAGRVVPAWVAALCKQDAVQFAEQSSAAAVWLVAPCVELYQDQRPDDTVDLVLGTEFKTLSHSDNIDAMLASLRPEATAPPDLSMLPKIHNGAC